MVSAPQPRGEIPCGACPAASGRNLRASRQRRVLLVDNFDSFTYNLVQVLGVLGVPCHVLENDSPELPETRAELAQFHALLISPGPGTPNTAGRTTSILGLAAGVLPVLGVCLGHQAIAAHFGARVTYATKPVHGKACTLEHDGRGLFRALPNPLRVARYHSLVVDPTSLPDALEVSARSADGEVLALRHRELPIEGVQFHPESILSELGARLLGNWLEMLDP